MVPDDDIIASHELEAGLDHFQFFMEDCDLDWGVIDLGRFYDEDAHARHLGIAPGLLSVHTARYGGPAHLEIIERGTAPNDDLTAWDNVAEASVELASGCLTVESWEHGPVTVRLSGPSAIYRVRVYTGGIATVINFDGYEGQDHYRVVFWPAPYEAPTLLRCASYPGEG
jgi:hypothetical protein